MQEERGRRGCSRSQLPQPQASHLHTINSSEETGCADPRPPPNKTRGESGGNQDQERGRQARVGPADRGARARPRPGLPRNRPPQNTRVEGRDPGPVSRGPGRRDGWGPVDRGARVRPRPRQTYPGPATARPTGGDERAPPAGQRAAGLAPPRSPEPPAARRDPRPARAPLGPRPPRMGLTCRPPRPPSAYPPRAPPSIPYLPPAPAPARQRLPASAPLSSSLPPPPAPRSSRCTNGTVTAAEEPPRSPRPHCAGATGRGGAWRSSPGDRRLTAGLGSHAPSGHGGSFSSRGKQRQQWLPKEETCEGSGAAEQVGPG
ncbi:basic proline-rich protein-like [Cynocephalus volans]|uniref:basic proline-rich protein-like n=1 Tax=Cynocephalus volans TaxID=110931 RepID=UPI002FC66D01